ncbi:calcium-binding protein, partial [Pseudahrensia aquimaris]
GGSGNDQYHVEDAGDVVVELSEEGYDRVFVDGLSSYTLPDHVERLTFVDAGNHVGKGNAGDNRLEGNVGKDRFLIDEGGADTYSGGNNFDVFDARGTSEQVRLYLNDQDLNGYAIEGDFFASIETFIGSSSAGDIMKADPNGRARFAGDGGDDRLWGSNNTDYMRGDAGNDDLRGGSGRDTIHGGTGNDDLRGGSGRDQFRFTEAEFGQDTIHDYQDGLDYLRFYSDIATAFSDFSVSGNGSNQVRVTL